MRTTTWRLAALAVFVLACAKDNQASTTGDSTSTDTAAMAGRGMDPDQRQDGNGVPAGFTGMTDKADAVITDARYTTSGNRWEVRTGPAHIVYAAKDSASGVYAVTTTIQQLEKPRHPEAYGVFFGGQSLDDRAKEKYGYFLVRGTGEYLIKVRDGTETTTIVNWTANPNVPKEDAAGKASYALKVHFAPDTAHFLVNDKLVAAVPRASLPTNGIAGLRINHNLHVAVEPVEIVR